MGNSERRDMDSRLLNWATWCTTWGGYPRASSHTGMLCDRMRRAVVGSAITDHERRTIDKPDALLLEQAMRVLATDHRMLLWWWYIRGEKRAVVCRMMRIPHRPASELDTRLDEARAALLAAVDRPSKNTVRTTV